jgi:hypothetical protein
MKRKKLDLTRCSQDQKRQKHTKGKKNNEDPNIEEFFFLERSSQKTKLIKCRKRVSILSCKLQKHLNRLRIRTTNRMSSVDATKTIFLILIFFYQEVLISFGRLSGAVCARVTAC